MQYIYIEREREDIYRSGHTAALHGRAKRIPFLPGPGPKGVLSRTKRESNGLFWLGIYIYVMYYIYVCYLYVMYYIM